MNPKELIIQFETQSLELTALIDGLCSFAFHAAENDITQTLAGSTPEMTIRLLTAMAGDRVAKMNEYVALMAKEATK